MDGLQGSGAERARGVVAQLGLDADHLAARRHRAGRDGGAGEQPAAAAGHQQEVERAGLLDHHLQRHGALAGDHVQMVIRRDDSRRRRLGQAGGDLLAVVDAGSNSTTRAP